MRNSALFEAYERNSPLSAINPAVKLAVSLIIMLVATAVFDLQSLIGIFALGLLVALLVGHVPIPVILRGLIPFFLFGIGYFWMNAVLPRDTGTVAFELGPLSVVYEGMWNGLRFGVRALCFGIYSILFATNCTRSVRRTGYEGWARVTACEERLSNSTGILYRYSLRVSGARDGLPTVWKCGGLEESRGRSIAVYPFVRLTGVTPQPCLQPLRLFSGSACTVGALSCGAGRSGTDAPHLRRCATFEAHDHDFKDSQASTCSAVSCRLMR